MIQIGIYTDGKNISDSFEHKDTTLIENALVLRRLEEIKLQLLTDFEYKPKFEVSEDGE